MVHKVPEKPQASESYRMHALVFMLSVYVCIGNKPLNTAIHWGKMTFSGSQQQNLFS